MVKLKELSYKLYEYRPYSLDQAPLWVSSDLIIQKIYMGQRSSSNNETVVDVEW